MSKFKVDPRAILDLVVFLGASASMYYLVSHVVNSVGDGSKADNKKKASASMQKLRARHPDMELQLNEHEQIIVSSVIMPEDIKLGFEGECESKFEY